MVDVIFLAFLLVATLGMMALILLLAVTIFLIWRDEYE